MTLLLHDMYNTMIKWHCLNQFTRYPTWSIKSQPRDIFKWNLMFDLHDPSFNIILKSVEGSRRKGNSQNHLKNLKLYSWTELLYKLSTNNLNEGRKEIWPRIFVKLFVKPFVWTLKKQKLVWTSFQGLKN